MRSPLGFRFSLAEMMILFVIVAAVCRWPILIGLAGSAVACAVAGKFRYPGNAATSPRRLYRILLPLLWLVAAMTSYQHPGDEYGMFIVSALPASWILAIVSESNIQNILPLVFMAGAVPVALSGWALDRLRVRLLLWLPLFLTITVALVLYSLSGYPTYQRAMAKNGSLTAYISAGSNLALYLSTIVSYLATLVIRVVQAVRQRTAAIATPAGTPAEARTERGMTGN